MTNNRSTRRMAPGIVTGIAVLVALAGCGLTRASASRTDAAPQAPAGLATAASTTNPVTPSSTTNPVTPQSTATHAAHPSPLPAPTQVSPADNALFTNYPRVTTLTW